MRNCNITSDLKHSAWHKHCHRTCVLPREVLIVGVAALVSASSADAQSICNQADVVFVGRAESTTTFRISGEAAIEKARQNYIRVEEDVKRERESLNGWTQLARNAEFASRLIMAKDELSMRQAMYPAPYDLTLTPVVVVQAFRGVSEQVVMVRVREGSVPMQAGEAYLILGSRSKNLIPPLPEMTTELGHVADYLEPQEATPVASAQPQLQFLASTMSGATVMGTLRMHSFGDGLPPALDGVRILVSSGAQVVETVTREDGSFVASGIAPGYLDITAELASDLTLVDRPTHKPFVRDGGCTIVGLRAAVDGRVRGRIISSSAAALDTVQLHLNFAHADRRMFGSHDPRFSTTARADGTFEFSGVSAGSYFLSASVQKSDGKSRHVTYFPGTDDLDAATPIVVGKATLHDGFDFIARTE